MSGLQVRFFFRIKRQTYTRPVKSPINILITNNLRACTCLFNIYTTCTRVVTLYKFTQWAKRCTKTDFCAENVYMLCTCCVYVEQTRTRSELSKAQAITTQFWLYVRVWRLILKKNLYLGKICPNKCTLRCLGFFKKISDDGQKICSRKL